MNTVFFDDKTRIRLLAADMNIRPELGESITIRTANPFGSGLQEFTVTSSRMMIEPLRRPELHVFLSRVEPPAPPKPGTGNGGKK